MSVVGGWVLAPLVLAATAIGLGLLAERVLGVRVPGGLLPGFGLAVLTVVAGILTLPASTAGLAVPACAGLALVGWAASARPRDRSWTWRGAIAVLATAAVVYLLHAAPSLLTGQASITGAVKLDDSANWLALTDHVLRRGHDLSGLAPSTYQLVLDGWLGSGYPVGAFLPLGVAARLSGVDLAAAYQPVIAFSAAVLAAGIAAVVRPLVGTRAGAASVGIAGALASIYVGYLQWGGLKEAATAALLPVLAWPAVRAWSPSAPARWLATTALAAGAVLGALGVNGAVWAAPALAIAGIGALRAARRLSPLPSSPLPSSPPPAPAGSDEDPPPSQPDSESGPPPVPAGSDVDPAPLVSAGRPERDLRSGRRRALVRTLGLGVLVALVAALPALVTVQFAQHTPGVLTDETEMGNLSGPVPLLQVAGLWPVGDFRSVPARPVLVAALAFVTALGATAGVALSLRRRRPELAALVGIALTGGVAAVLVGSPWVDAKALAIVAPCVLAAAATAAAVGLRSPSWRPQVPATALAVTLAVGLVWSTLAVIGQTWVAPRASLAELRALSTEIAGEGPTLVLDFDTYADRWYLRAADPEGATDLRHRQVVDRQGGYFPHLSTAEVDLVADAELLAYRTLVRRASPSASRPPSPFELIHAGPVWEAWQRPPDSAPPLARLPLGAPPQVAAVPSCAEVTALAATPGAAWLDALPRDPAVVAALTDGTVPPSWLSGDQVLPDSPGTLTITVDAPATGTYRLWVGGLVLGRLSATVDGRDAGSVRHQLGHAGLWQGFATLPLEAGPHEVALTYEQPFGGSAGPPPPLGPLALAPLADPEAQPERVPVARAEELCDGRAFDWIEAAAP